MTTATYIDLNYVNYNFEHFKYNETPSLPTTIHKKKTVCPRAQNGPSKNVKALKDIFGN